MARMELIRNNTLYNFGTSEEIYYNTIKNHFESAETHENNMKRAFKSASDIVSTSEKIKNQMEKAEESIKEIEDKNNG